MRILSVSDAIHEFRGVVSRYCGSDHASEEVCQTWCRRRIDNICFTDEPLPAVESCSLYPQGIVSLFGDADHLGQWGYAPAQACAVVDALKVGAGSFPQPENPISRLRIPVTIIDHASEQQPAPPISVDDPSGWWFKAGFPGADMLSIDTSVEIGQNGTSLGTSEFDCRLGLFRIGMSYYFDFGLFMSANVEAFGWMETHNIVYGRDRYGAYLRKGDNMFEIDTVLEAGYFIPVMQRAGIEFFGGAKLGYREGDLMLNAVAADPVTFQSFYSAAGGGIEWMMWGTEGLGFQFGVEYWRALTSDGITADRSGSEVQVTVPPDELAVTIGLVGHLPI